VGLEPGNSLFKAQQSQSYKIAKLPDRSPGIQERFFIRYIGKDEEGNKIVGDLSPALVFTNAGLETKVFPAPTLTLTAQSFSYLAAWEKPSSSVYPNYLYTEVFESITLSNFTAQQLTDPAVSGMGTFTSNSVVIPTGASLALRYVKIRHVMTSNGVLVYSPLSTAVSTTPTTPDASDQTPPDVPSGFAATGYNDSTDPSGNTGYVLLSWNASAASDVKGYTVKFGRTASTLDTYMTFGKVTSGRLDNLRAGTTYYFSIASNDGVNNSTFSSTISAAIPVDATAPVAPTGLSAVAGLNNIIAYWNRNSETDVDLGRGTYQFQLATANTFIPASILYDKSGSATVASFTGLTTGTTYYVRVRAIDSTGNLGAFSSAVSATPGKASAQDLLTSGTIVGDLIASNTIVGSSILTDSLDANKIKTNTALVGVLNVGANNAITIDGNSTNKSIYIGAGTYGNANTPFYAANEAGIGRFSLGNKLTWDGANLAISGAVNITSNTTLEADLGLTNPSGTIYLGATKTLSNARILLNSGGLFAYPSGSNTANFALSNDGTAIFRNSISTGGQYPLVLDGSNDRIVFSNGGAGFTLDQDSETITTYTITGYTNDTGSADDFWYGRYYSTWSPVYSTSVTEANSISLKRTSTSGAQPSITLSAAGTGFSRIKNVSSGLATSEIVLQDGGILFNGQKGGYKRENLATTPHYTWSGINSGSGAEIGVSLVIKSDGTLTTGRAFYKSGASESSITSTSTASTNVWKDVGLIGDIIFSTAD
jgi:hypothetical protein